MAGTVFFKVGWDSINAHLPADYVAVFEPEAGLPPIKSMLAQTQGGAACSTNARRWCVHTLYASLKRIEELEAMACLGGDEASKQRIKKLEADLTTTKGLLESRGRDMDDIMTALADVPAKGSIPDRINYLLAKNRELAKGDPGLTTIMTAAAKVLFPNGMKADDSFTVKDVVQLLTKMGESTIGCTNHTEEMAQKDAEIVGLNEQLKRLQTSNKIINDILDPIILAAAKRLYPGGTPHGAHVGAPEIVKLINSNGQTSDEVVKLRDALKKAKATGQVYYSGWKSKGQHLSPEGLSRLQEELASLQSRGINLPAVGLTEGGRLSEEDTVAIVIATLNALDPDAPKAAPVAVSPTIEPALDPKVTIQALETELAQLKDQMLDDEHTSLELQNKLTSVAAARDSLHNEIKATWEWIPEDYKGDATNLPAAVEQMAKHRRWLMGTLQEVEEALPEAYRVQPDQEHEPLGATIQRLAAKATGAKFSRLVAETWTEIPQSYKNADGVELPMAVRSMAKDLRAGKDTLEDREDQLSHLQDMIRDLTTDLTAKPFPAVLEAGGHQLYLHSFSADGACDRMPSRLTFLSSAPDEKRRPVSPEGAVGIAPPLQATYIREDVTQGIASLVAEAKQAVGMVAEERAASPQELVHRAVDAMLTKVLDKDYQHSPTGRLDLEWRPEKGMPCQKAYDGYESAMISTVESIVPRTASTPQEGIGFVLDINHLTVLLAWQGTHPAEWKQGVVPLASHQTV